MQLYNYNITVGRLLANPQARAVIDREFPGLLQNPMVRFARRMTLRQLLQRAKGIGPQEKIERVLRELETL